MTDIKNTAEAAHSILSFALNRADAAPASDPMVIIRARLKHRRVAAELTCADLARRLGVHEATVYKYETGDRTPGGIELARWAHAVGFSFGGLVAIADRHHDVSLWASVVAGEYQRVQLDRTGTIRNHDHAKAVRMAAKYRAAHVQPV